MGIRLHKSYDWLHRRYVLNKVSIAEMAKEARVSELTIRRALNSAGLIR